MTAKACPNCQQVVEPKTQYGWQTWLVGLGVWVGGSYLFRYVGWFGGNEGPAAFALALALARPISRVYRKTICPNCGANMATPAASDPILSPVTLKTGPLPEGYAVVPPLPMTEPPEQFVERLRQWMRDPDSQLDLEQWYRNDLQPFLEQHDRSSMAASERLETTRPYWLARVAELLEAHLTKQLASVQDKDIPR